MTKHTPRTPAAALGGALLVLTVACGVPESRSLPVYERPPQPGPGTVAASRPSTPDPARNRAAIPAAAQIDETPRPEATREPTRTGLRVEAGNVLDDWHDAAAVGDRNRYVGHFSPDAVFMGTDATERWDLATFAAYVEEHFGPDGGWTYKPSNRHVTIGPNAQVAWFDEALESAGYGALRGTGVLRRVGDSWRIAHYSMTFTVPNDIARDVVEIVRESAR